MQYTVDGRLRRLTGEGAVRISQSHVYTGLGHLYSTNYVSTMPRVLADVSDISTTDTRGDALGNRWQQWSQTGTSSYVPFEHAGFPGQRSYADRVILSQYAPNGTGRLARTFTQGVVGSSAAETLYEYDLAGNTTAILTPVREGSGNTGDPIVAGQDRLMYYDAANQLRVTEARRTDAPNLGQTVLRLVERDEAVYDALGRRVGLSSRRRCYENNEFASAVCREVYVQRTVWAGSQEVYEDRVPLDTLYATPGIAPGDARWDQIPTLPVKEYPGAYYDPNPFFGAVAYGYGPTVDQPLIVVRAGYRDRWTSGGPTLNASVYAPAPFVVFPHWSPLGYANLATTRDGGQFHCTGSVENCTFAVAWGMSWSPYNPDFGRRPSWMGSLLEDKKEANGLQYRRNRYVDPVTGRFTQPDPIGIAGGLNLYGFAAGDPVNFADPFGLAADTVSVAPDARDPVAECLQYEFCRDLLGVAHRDTAKVTIRMATDDRDCLKFGHRDGCYSAESKSIILIPYTWTSRSMGSEVLVHELGHFLTDRFQPGCKGDQCEVIARQYGAFFKRSAGQEKQ
jgi:RHS repeat-associated protein